MPSPSENLWLALKGLDYDEMLKILTANPDLVNDLEPVSGLPLIKKILIGDKPLKLISFIITNPKFALDYLNADLGESNIDLILERKPEILALVINDPKVLVNKGQLTFAGASKSLVTSTNALGRAIKKDPLSKSAVEAKTKVAHNQTKVTMLREATIRHALATDEPLFLAKLEEAGDDLSKPLSDGSQLMRLITAKTPNLGKWSLERLGKSMAQSSVAAAGVGSSQVAFFGYQQAQAQVDAAQLAHKEKQSALLAAKAEKREALLDNAVASGPK